MRLRRVVIAGTVTALLGAAIAVTVVNGPVEPPVAALAEAPDEVTAMTAAQLQNSRVEVLDERTPTRVVWANPGGTLTAELHAVPVRVLKGGAWRPVDQDLQRRPDGTVEPKAAVGELVLSGGGDDAPLAQMRSEGKRFSVRWPAPLPEPVLDGATATYPEVLPGVDLLMHAERAGYRQHLVVKTPAAAKNPALKSIRMRVDAGGLRVRADKSGALSAVDGKGAVVFSSPPAVMWDAKSRKTRVAIALGKGTMDLRPDLKFLADPATVFPVTIDPDWTPGKHGWTSVLSGKPNDTYWNSSGDGSTAQVGQCYDVGYCDGIKEAWSYFQWDTSALNGRAVHTATFNTAIRSSPNCTNKQHMFYRAHSPVGTGTTWNNKPGGTLLAEFTAQGVYTNCSGWKPVGHGIATEHISMTGFTTFLITAKDSTDQGAWRKYDPASTTLTINYNTAPHNPTELHTEPSLNPPCRWCDGVSYYGADSIRLKARMSDPDGDQVNANWRISRNGVAGETGWSAFRPSGSLHDVTLGLGDAENGKMISFGAIAGDGRAAGAWVDWSGRFVSDRVGITSKPLVEATVYTEDNRWHGGVGVADTFTFKPNWTGPDPSKNDIDHYLYGWHPDPSTPVAANALGGSATIPLAPEEDGPQTLYVQSVDRAGHKSPVEEHRFYVRAGNGALAQYSFEGNARDTAFLGDRHATLRGGAGFTAQGAVGSAAALGGAPAHLTAPAAVHTDGPFSVSAWVKLSSLPAAGHTYTALSQDGGVVSGFMLGYRNTDGGQWELYSPSADSATRPADEAVRVKRPVTLNTWTHVAGVFDPTAGNMRLYVNGKLADTATAARTKGFDATGAFAVGRSLWNGAQTNHWPGAIDEVQVHDRVLSAAEIEAAVSTSGVQLAHWKLDDGTGATARNAVDGGIDGVLEKGAAFTAAGAVGGGLLLDGIDDAMATTGPVVRTDQSFTVTAQVKLTRFDTGTYTVLSQDGTRFCGFCLQYQNGRWVFVFVDADVDTPAAYYWAGATAVPKVNGYTHLVGTYDADTDKVRLYVDGVMVGETTRPVSWNASGPFQVGRALVKGVPSQHLPGTVDEVRVLGRAVTLDEVRGLLSRDNVSAGQWRFDGNLLDARNRAELTGNPADTEYSAGQTDIPNPDDLAVRLNGTDDHVHFPGVIRTDESFAVTAWARLDRIGGHPAVMSQDGTNVSGFWLRALPNGKWSFRVQEADVHNGNGGEVASGAIAQPGVWTHLVGVYRKDLGRVELYVNGVLAGSAPHAGGFRATGAIQVGRAKWNGVVTDYFPGAVDDVAVYSRPLFAAEITSMAGRDQSLGHNWTLDEGTGATSGDTAGSRQAALGGGAAFAPGRVGNAVRLDGVDDVVTTEAVDVRTDASFTVSAWVNLESKDCDFDATSVCMRSAVALDGGGTEPSSKFRLGHRMDDQGNDGKWVFEMPEDDGWITDAAIAVRPDQLNSWVHLTGVYNASAKAIYLYVNGNYEDDGTLVKPWQGTGGLTIGHGWRNGATHRFWHGSVDDVRLYSGALDDARVTALVRSYPAVGADAAMPVANAGHWKFNEGSGTTAADTSAAGRPMTLHGAAGWNGGRDAGSLWLDGNGGHAETAGTVLDTSTSFSVSAWVALTDSTKYAAVFGQDGNVMSTFYLQYDAGAQKWGAVVPKSDSTNAALDQVLSLEPAPLNAWTHLTVVYHKPSTQLRLYVNGSLSGVKTDIVPKPSTGPLSVGRCKWNGAKACYFPKGVDDVRAFTKALTDGEVRRVHDDAPAVSHGTWRFDDGTVTDASWRANPTTASGAVSYPQGVSGTALGLDGVSASATAANVGVPMRDSFTVSAWARLSRGDKTATVLGQDGSRQSGFTVQYRPAVNRWMFGAATHDADNVPTVYAASVNPPALNRWTHLTGVYDLPARQLRIYVDGHLVGTRGNVLLWQANGGFSIGRGKVNGLPAEFFPGAVDEVTTDLGVARDHDILARASRPAPSGGHLGRFVNATGDHRSVDASSGFWDQFAPMPDQYKYEGPLGMLLDAEAPGTHRLYSCLAGTDSFTSTAADCGGSTKLADLGWAYTQPPAGVSTAPLHACRFGQERGDSMDPACEGGTADGVLGHLLAYAPLVRYLDSRRPDHAATTSGMAPGYRREGTLGLLARSASEPGTQKLQSCLSGNDRFLSTDPTCGGATVVHTVGGIWTAPPPGLQSQALYQCQASPNNRFEAASPTCDGRPVLGLLGYVLTAVPAPGA
ncbi:LamG domain-containing protein [Actinokineospora sp. 24-640]